MELNNCFNSATRTSIKEHFEGISSPADVRFVRNSPARDIILFKLLTARQRFVGDATTW